MTNVSVNSITGGLPTKYLALCAILLVVLLLLIVYTRPKHFARPWQPTLKEDSSALVFDDPIPVVHATEAFRKTLAANTQGRLFSSTRVRRPQPIPDTKPSSPDVKAQVSPSTTPIKDTQRMSNDIAQSEKFYAEHLPARKAAIASGDFKLIKLALQVQSYCTTRARVGAVGDGGKFVCNPWKLPNSCVIYSLGLAGKISFELQLSQMVRGRNCRFFGFESARMNPDIYKGLPGGQAHQYLITTTTDATKNHYRIDDLMKKFSSPKIDIFKIDIEGSEYSTIGPALADMVSRTQTFACQILIEVHFLAKNHTSLLELFERKGYLLFTKEPNPYCGHCMELAYIHETCREQYGATPKFLNNFNP